MILFYTDFGTGGPYLGQMRLSIERHAPSVPVIDLMSDLSPHEPRAAAYLLAALSGEIPPGSVLSTVAASEVLSGAGSWAGSASSSADSGGWNRTPSFERLKSTGVAHSRESGIDTAMAFRASATDASTVQPAAMRL